MTLWGHAANGLNTEQLDCAGFAQGNGMIRQAYSSGDSSCLPAPSRTDWW